MDDTAMKRIWADCLRCASTSMVLVATMTMPELPMMVVDTVRVDASTMSNAPIATLVAAIDTVLVSLMAAAPTA